MTSTSGVFNQIKTVFLLGLLTSLLLAIGQAVAPGNLYLFLGMSVLMNVGAYFFSDRMVLAMHRAKEVTYAEAPDLHQMVEELARRADIPKPRVFIVQDPQPNAFATGRNPKHGVVAVNTGLLRMLTPREVKGVVAHEIAHIKNRDILISTIAATMAAALSYIAHALQWGAMFGGASRSDDEEGGSPIGALAMAFIAPIAGTLIQLAISRSREFIADETGARLSGDPEGLARALARLSDATEMIPSENPEPATASLHIANPLTGMGGLMSLFTTHPPMEQRIARLMEQAKAMGPV